VAAAAKKAGKTWGRPVASAAEAREMLDLGAGFLACGADLLMVKTGMERIQEDFAPLGFTFDNQVK
jgi:4-hydroxy-2-oxoheptanedioate aldolase